MSKKKKISKLRERIMVDIQDINLLLELITSYRAETHLEAVILARVALEKSKLIDKNNEKIGSILDRFGKPRNINQSISSKSQDFQDVLTQPS